MEKIKMLLVEKCIAKNIISKRLMSRFFVNQEISNIVMWMCIERRIQLDDNDFSKYYQHNMITNDEVLQYAMQCYVSNINYRTETYYDQEIPEQFDTDSLLSLFPRQIRDQNSIDLPQTAIVVDGANWCRIENGTMDFTKLDKLSGIAEEVYVVFNEHHQKKLKTENVKIVYSSKKVDDDLACLYIALRNKVKFYSNDNHSDHFGPNGIFHGKQREIMQFKSKYNVKFEYNKKDGKYVLKPGELNIRKIHNVNGKMYVPINNDKWLCINCE
jgi:hypothetical protein